MYPFFLIYICLWLTKIRMSGYERNRYGGRASIKAQAIVATHMYFHCHSHLSAGYPLGRILYVERFYEKTAKEFRQFWTWLGYTFIAAHLLH
jgi:hypothetical protein